MQEALCISSLPFGVEIQSSASFVAKYAGRYSWGTVQQYLDGHRSLPYTDVKIWQLSLLKA